jgi:membrane protein implicated in regulation of membrane protease activity
MDYEPVTRRSDLILAASCVVVFCAAALVSTLERALVFAVASGVFLAIFRRSQSRAEMSASGV